MAAKFRVMIVDDTVFFAEALRRLLERGQYEVIGIEETASEALVLAAREKPDIALVDVNLRDGSTGPALGQALSQDGVGIVFVSGATDLEHVRAQRVGDVLRKPAGDARLLRAVLDVVKQRGRR